MSKPKTTTLIQLVSLLVASVSLLVWFLPDFKCFTLLRSLVWRFGHLRIWIWFVIWILSFEIIWQSRDNSWQSRRPL